MATTAYHKLQAMFRVEHVLFWSNLSRMNGLLIILNISMFFLTGLVAKGYYYTCYSLAALGLVGFGMLIPTRLVNRLGYYWLFVAVELVAAYFLVASIIYWLNQGTT